MKKLLSKIVAVILVAATLCFCTSCKEIENGSEIHRIKITVTLYDEDGNASDQDVYAKLYKTFAPETVAHIEELISSGYYNGVCISNVSSSYAQFGDAKVNDNDDHALNFIDQGSSVAGEFLANGWKGNKLTSDGALVLKHDADLYDSGKATVAISFSSGAFKAEKYCIFGKFVTDDGDAEADEDSWEYKSSLEKIKTLTELTKTDDGVCYYYCDADDTDVEGGEGSYNWKGQYVTYSEETGEYYKGTSVSGEVLSDEEQKDFEDKKSENSANFRIIPAKKVVIKSISIVK